MGTKTEKFIEKAKKRHGDKYDYSQVEYIDSRTKVCIICPEHGPFYQEPSAHIRGDGCPLCANEKRGRYNKISKEEFIKKSNEVHNNKYTYDNVIYKDINTKVLITCPEHGDFKQTPIAHLHGQGCPKCAGKGLTTEDIVKMFQNVHGNTYDYSKVVYTKMNDEVCIICPKHGEFYQTPKKHLQGQGCKQCAIEKKAINKTMTLDVFKAKANTVHNGKYNYDKVEYINSHDDVIITCPTHGDFKQKPYIHLSGHGCPTCGNNISRAEDEIADFIESLGVTVIKRVRTVLDGGSEIDIFLPEYNVGVEYNGLYWHSELFKENKYHYNKTNQCAEKNIRLIQIFEDEWMFKKEIVKSRIRCVLNKVNNRIYARKCDIRIVNKAEKCDFVSKNHLQGDVNSKINLGLYYNNELVSMMTFGNPRINLGHKTKEENEYELLRFCNKLNTLVIGGASKLFKYFIETYTPFKITSYCDRRWSVGNMYEKLGFTMDHISQPNYFYVNGNNRQNRFKYRKSELVKLGFDANKSEKQIMQENNFYRIYDSGAIVYVWTKK